MLRKLKASKLNLASYVVAFFITMLVTLLITARLELTKIEEKTSRHLRSIQDAYMHKEICKPDYENMHETANNLELTPLPYSSITQKYPYVYHGGIMIPDSCQPTYNIALLIPYRDREKHLKILLQNLIPIMRKQNLQVRIIVIEQSETEKFNKAMVLNTGYLEAMKIDPTIDCLILHDVDFVPERDQIRYWCVDDETPRHLTAVSSMSDYKAMYRGFIGGAMVLREYHMRKCNGFPTVYWGWGGEDDEMGWRLRKVGLKIHQENKKIGTYFNIGHTRPNETSHQWNWWFSRHNRVCVDGLTSTVGNYHVTNIDVQPLFTKITVDLNKKAVMKYVGYDDSGHLLED